MNSSQPTPKPGEVDDYAKVAAEIAALVAAKQAAYGDAFGKSGAVMAILYPEGIPPEKLADALTVVRVVDKLFRIATDRDALGESPWRDIAGYALLECAKAARRSDPVPCPVCRFWRGDLPHLCDISPKP